VLGDAVNVHSYLLASAGNRTSGYLIAATTGAELVQNWDIRASGFLA